MSERLELVEIITSLNRIFLDPGRIRVLPDGGWTHPWQYFDALRNYLLLTCFDVLAQPSDYLSFRDWLSAKKTHKERSIALDRASVETDLIEKIKTVYQEYLAIYGTRNSFYRFVRTILPEDARNELLHSIQIRKIDAIKNIELGIINEAGEKIAFLYRIRNEFTHSAVGTGSPGGGVWDFHGKWLEIDGKPMKGWETIYWECKGAHRIEYGVRDWPDVLVRTVKTGFQAVSEGADINN